MTALDRSLETHREAVTMLVAALNSVPDASWNEPFREGKWTPGEIAAHLVATWDALLGELAGGQGMRIRTSWWQRGLLRLVLVPKLLAGGPFPANAKAPRETRPAAPLRNRAEAVDAVEARASSLEREARKADELGMKLTHAYFGKSTVANGVLLAARHIQHHSAQISRAFAAEPPAATGTEAASPAAGSS
jgi:hypothetical protein